MRRNNFLRLAALASVAALVTTGCLQGGDDGGGGDGGGTSSGAGGTTPGDGEVEIVGAFTGAEQDAFEDTIAGFEEDSGIDIQYAGNADFTTLIRTRINSDPPDIALFPQPGLLLDLAADDNIVPIDEFLDADGLNETLIPGFLESVTDEDGTVYGAPMRMAVKSLVWVPKAYAEQGYSLEPASVQELNDIAQEIAGSGTAPWCIGYEAGAGTGWVGTDWVEEFVLRTAGPDVYDQWVAHEIPFNDPQIQEAFEAYRELLGGEEADNVLGGADGILNTSFLDADNPQFESPPGCMMQRQGNFVTGFYPEDVQANLDESVDVFAFPPYEGGYEGQPILGGGDMAALFNGEDEEAQQVMEFLTSDEFGAEWAQAGGWLSPHTTFDATNYPDETTRRIAELAAGADVFRYDASDLMPAEVGADSFWDGSVEWIQGASTEEVTTKIEESWPSE